MAQGVAQVEGGGPALRPAAEGGVVERLAQLERRVRPVAEQVLRLPVGVLLGRPIGRRLVWTPRALVDEGQQILDLAHPLLGIGQRIGPGRSGNERGDRERDRRGACAVGFHFGAPSLAPSWPPSFALDAGAGRAPSSRCTSTS